MIIRVRSRDGLGRVNVPDGATVNDLTMCLREQLKIPADHAIVLSRDQKLLLAKDETISSFKDFSNPSALIGKLGLRHGDMIFLWSSLERVVEGPKVPVVPAGSYGKKMTVEELIAKQIRIERQEKPHCSMLSFDHSAANEFQMYVNETLGFSIQRGGFMYGTCDEEGQVRVEFIYEPPQTGTESSLMLHRNEVEERCVDAIAAGLGMRRVGFIFTRSAAQSGDEDVNYTLSAAEIRIAAELHAEALGLTIKRMSESDEAMPDAMANGQPKEVAKDFGSDYEGFKAFSIGLVSLTANEEGGSDVHFEAFQLSDQCVKLFASGLFLEPDEPACEEARAARKKPGSANAEEEEPNPAVTRTRKEVIVARKDIFEVDNDFFLVAVSIGDHEGPLRCTFPVENRIVTATEKDLKTYLEKTKGIAQFSKRLADFHLLLFLGRILDPVNDIPVLAQAVHIEGPVPEGYQLIIESF